MRNDTLQAEYRRYKDKGVPRKELTQHLLTVAGATIGFIWLSGVLLAPLMKSVGTGLAATAAFCAGLVWLLRQFDKSDPIEKREADRKEFERLRTKLLEDNHAR